MVRAFAFVLVAAVACHGASCHALLVNFTAIDGQYADPDASNGTSVNLWTNTPSGNFGTQGSFLGNSVNNSGGTNNGSAGAGNPAWTLYASGGQLSRSDATISPWVGRNTAVSGDSIALDLDTGTVQSGGEVGVTFYDQNNNHQFTFRLVGGASTYTILDDAGVFNTGIASTRNGFRLTLTLLDQIGGYSLNVFNTQSPNPINATFGPRVLDQNSPTIAAIRVYNLSSGAAPLFDLFFNNVTFFTAIPEASHTLMFSAVSLVTCAGVLTRRRWGSNRRHD